MDYEKYTGLVSKFIHKKITPNEVAQVAKYEASAPLNCPHCGIQTKAQVGVSIVHDVATCIKKKRKRLQIAKFMQN
jgi:hypothetical protein